MSAAFAPGLKPDSLKPWRSPLSPGEDGRQSRKPSPQAKRGASIRDAPPDCTSEADVALRRLRHVLGCRTLLTFDDVELHRVALSKGLESRAADRAVVDEAILLPVVRSDETKALRIVEPLHFAGRTHSLLLENLCLGSGELRPTLDNLCAGLVQPRFDLRGKHERPCVSPRLPCSTWGENSKVRLSRQ